MFETEKNMIIGKSMLKKTRSSYGMFVRNIFSSKGSCSFQTREDVFFEQEKQIQRQSQRKVCHSNTGEEQVSCAGRKS